MGGENHGPWAVLILSVTAKLASRPFRNADSTLGNPAQREYYCLIIPTWTPSKAIARCSVGTTGRECGKGPTYYGLVLCYDFEF